MARLVSLAARTAADAHASDEVEIVLLVFRHPDLDAPLRFSTDPTLRLSDDPLLYGTRSRWQVSDPTAKADDYHFVIASTLLPDDDDDAPGLATLVLELLDYRMVEPLRSFTHREATVDLAVVLSSTPDRPEIEYLGMQLMSASGDAARITLTIGPEDDEQEPHCAYRMTRMVTPALWP